MAKTFGIAFSQTDPRTYPSLAPTFLTFQSMVDGSAITPPGVTQLSVTGIYFFNYTPTIPIYFLLDGITTSTLDRYVYGILDPLHRVDEVAATLIALGNSGLALGTTAVAIGTSNIALGTTAVAIGTTGVALGTTSVALGITGVALGNSGVALGTTAVALATSIMAGVANISLQSGEILNRIGATTSSFGTSAVDPGDLYGYLKRVQEFLEGDKTFTKTSGVWDVKSRGGSLLVSKTMSNSSSTVTSD